MENHKKTAVLIIVALTVAIQICPLQTSAYGISLTSPMWSRLVYHFFHASWLHLLLNAYVLLVLAFKLDLRMYELPLSYLIASIVPLCCVTAMPTVGLSGMIYALLGMRTMRSSNPMAVIANIVLITALSVFMSHIAWKLHAFSYVCGLILSILVTPLQWRKK